MDKRLEETIELVKKARKGNKNARREVIERYYPRVQKYVRKHRWGEQLKRKYKTLELADSIIINVIKEIDRTDVTSEARFIKNLQMMVLNDIRDKARKLKAQKCDVRKEVAFSRERFSQSRPPKVFVECVSPASLSGIDAKRKFRLVTDAMKELSDKEYEIINLRSFEDMSFPQIAKQLRITPDAARRRFDRALKKLQDIVAAFGTNPKIESALKKHSVAKKPARKKIESMNLVGKTIDGFKIISEIGQGGFGTVYRAERNIFGQSSDVAFKVINHRHFNNEDVIRLFMDEAGRISKLKHVGIAPLYSAGCRDDIYYMAMEYVLGLPLLDLIHYARVNNKSAIEPHEVHRMFRHYLNKHNFNTLPMIPSGNTWTEIACSIIAETSEAVAYANRKGVLHLDIKPANIILGYDGRPRLLDFGLSALLNSMRTGLPSGGTPGYAAPEQFLGSKGPVDRRTDVFGLGATLYELLCFDPPYKSASTKSNIDETYWETCIPLTERNPNIPRKLAAIVMKAIEKDPSRRFESVAVFREAIRRYSGREEPRHSAITAIGQLHSCAERGDADAQACLGFEYSTGSRIKKDLSKAFEWFLKAAQQGNARAQYDLGVMYGTGQGVSKDLNKAFEWYRKAAEQGDADAQNAVGRMYFRGDGVPADAAKAVAWWQKAAAQGLTAARKNIKAMYKDGEAPEKT